MEIEENDQAVVMTNPMLGYSIREDGIITIYAYGESGQQFKMFYTEVDGLEDASQGFEDAAFALNLFHSHGFDTAFDYVEAGASEFTVDDNDIETFLQEDD